MLKIGDFSSVCQVTIKALRHYDRLGLLHPARVDPYTGHRFYRMSQVAHLNRIRALKEMDLSLEEIKRVLDEALSPEEVRGMLRLKQAKLRAEIDAAQTRMRRVETQLRQLDLEGNMSTYNVVMKAIPAQRVLALREMVSIAEGIAPLFGEIDRALKAQKIVASGAWIALYHHEGFRDTDLDVEIAVPVAESVREAVTLDADRKLELRETSAYKQAATVIENGHNADWSGSYTALGQFIEANGYAIGGAVREVYLTSPDDESGWLVEIQFPVKTMADASA